MWCPQCRSEFVEGFTRCATCGVDLVERLPSEPRPVARPGPAAGTAGTVSFLEPVRASEDRDRFVSVFEGTQAQAVTVRRRLEAALIPANLWSRRDEAEAAGGDVSVEGEDESGHDDLVRVEVPLSYFEEARALVGSGVPEAPEPISLESFTGAQPLASARSGMPLISWVLLAVAVLVIVGLVLSR